MAQSETLNNFGAPTRQFDCFERGCEPWSGAAARTYQ